MPLDLRYRALVFWIFPKKTPNLLRSCPIIWTPSGETVSKGGGLKKDQVPTPHSRSLLPSSAEQLIELTCQSPRPSQGARTPPSRLARPVPPADHQRVRVLSLSPRQQPITNVPLVSHPRMLQAHVCFVMEIITLRNANHSGGNTTRTERRSSSRDGYVWAVRPVMSIKLESVRTDVNVKHVLVVT